MTAASVAMQCQNEWVLLLGIIIFWDMNLVVALGSVFVYRSPGAAKQLSDRLPLGLIQFAVLVFVKALH